MEDLEAVLREQFDLLDGEAPADFLRKLGVRLRALENDLFGDELGNTYFCHECGKRHIDAAVEDASLGAVYMSGMCSYGDADVAQVAGAALERRRLANILGYEQADDI